MAAATIVFVSAARARVDFDAGRDFLSRAALDTFLLYCTETADCIVVSEMNRDPDNAAIIIGKFAAAGFNLVVQALKNDRSPQSFSTAIFAHTRCAVTTPMVVELRFGSLVDANRVPMATINGITVVGYHGTLDPSSTARTQLEYDSLKMMMQTWPRVVIVGDANKLAEHVYEQPAANRIGNELATFFPFPGDHVAQTAIDWLQTNAPDNIIREDNTPPRVLTQLDVVWCNDPTLSMTAEVLHPATLQPFQSIEEQRQAVRAFPPATQLASDHFPLCVRAAVLNSAV